jgi:hypothetical protein
MNFEELLNSLSGDERSYIANRDYGNDEEKHRDQLDIVIQRGGAVDMATQYWFPYEVIELCKNDLEEGHEREFTSCVGIILKNMLDDNDKANDIDFVLDCITPQIPKLPPELTFLVNQFIDKFIG